MHQPGRVPDRDELPLVVASEALVMELFARLDATDIDGALDLYASDGVLLGAQGRDAIRDTMLRGMAPNAEHRTRHVIANVRSEVREGGTVVEYTAVAYTLDGPGPFAPRSVLDQVQHHRLGADGRLRIAHHEVLGFEP